MVSKLRVSQLETLDGLNTKNVATLVDDLENSDVTTSTGTQTVAGALNTRKINYNPIVLGAVGDGLANDTDIFVALESYLEGVDVDLMGRSYVVDYEPLGNRYFNGQFIVDGVVISAVYSLSETPFGKSTIKPAVSSQDSHVGFSSGLVDVSIDTQTKWVLIYRRSPSHGLINGSQTMAADSYDEGQTWVNHRVIYTTANFDTRSQAVANFDNGRIGFIATRRDPDGVYTDPVFVYSDDRGLTWSSIVVPAPAPDSKINFHSSVLKYPTSVGGADDGGWIVYSYGINDGVDAWYTLNNGDSWQYIVDVATPDAASSSDTSGLTYALSESVVCEAGEGQWLMFCRNASPVTVGDSNAVAYKSIDMTTWTGPYDTGLLLANNPPEVIYDGGRVWLMAFSRQGRPAIPSSTSHLLSVDAPANELFSASGQFTSLGRQWRKVTSIPDWASGYLQSYRIKGRWYGTFVCQERPAVGVRTVLCMLGDFIPVSVSLDDVVQAAPKENLLINGGFDIWQRGTSFNTEASIYTADRWLVAGSSGENCSVSRGDFDLGNPAFRGNPRHYLSMSGNATGRHWVSQRVESVRKTAGERVTLSFWARSAGGATVGFDEIRAIQNLGTGGSPSPATSTLFAENISLSGTWRKFNFSITLPSLVGKVLGTDGNDYLWIICYTQAGAYDIQIADIKFEISGVATPFVRKPVADELESCQRYYQKSYPQSVAPGAASSIIGSLQDRSFSDAAAFGVNFNVNAKVTMRDTPTVTLYSPDTGTQGVMRNATSGTDVSASATNVADSGFCLRNNAAFTIGDLVRVHYDAEAEL